MNTTYHPMSTEALKHYISIHTRTREEFLRLTAYIRFEEHIPYHQRRGILVNIYKDYKPRSMNIISSLIKERVKGVITTPTAFKIYSLYTILEEYIPPSMRNKILQNIANDVRPRARYCVDF